MTLINQLIKQAAEGATVLEVPENHVGSVAEHIRAHMCHSYPGITAAACERVLRDGEARLRGVPMRVVPKREG